MSPIRDLDSSNLIHDISVLARPVDHQDYLNALKNVKKSVSHKELEKFITWDNEFGAA